MHALMLIIGLAMGYWLSSGESTAEWTTMFWILFMGPISLAGGIAFAILVILFVFGIIGHILNKDSERK